MTTQSNPIIVALEQQLKKLEQQTLELHKRVSYLERENNRTKSNLVNIEHKVNKKG
jgi:hypothetical protein